MPNHLNNRQFFMASRKVRSNESEMPSPAPGRQASVRLKLRASGSGETRRGDGGEGGSLLKTIRQTAPLDSF